MKIELKNGSLKEIMKIVRSNNLNIENVFVECTIITDISICEDKVNLFLNVKDK